MKRHTLSLAAVTLLALATVPAAYAGGTEISYAKALSADAMYVGGAVIIGSVTLGAILGTRFATGLHSNLEGIGALMIVGGALTAAGAQWFGMMYAGGHVPATLYDIILATSVGVLMIIAGFGMITIGRLVSAMRNAGQSAQGKTGDGDE